MKYEIEYGENGTSRYFEIYQGNKFYVHGWLFFRQGFRMNSGWWGIFQSWNENETRCCIGQSKMGNMLGPQIYLRYEK